MTASARRPDPELPQHLERVHIIGICGTAMAALAGMLRERGVVVTGSDAMAYPPMSDVVRGMGIEIRLGYRPEHVEDGPDLVVVGNVSRRDNPEAVRAIELGLPYASLPEVLRLVFLPGRRGIVVTGTHGKTTTSSLVAWLLCAAGRDPSYLIGGVPGNFGSNYRLGDGVDFVLEGDEYDTAYFDKVPKFWHYPATIATVNNLEFDHADIYRDVGEIEHVFRVFAGQVAPGGVLWVNGQDARALEAAQAARCAVKRFGLAAGDELTATGAQEDEAGTRFTLVREGEELGEMRSPLFGEYNLRNTLGAVGVSLEAGLSFEAIAEGLSEFRGVLKRQTIVGEARGVLVIDDFAHHPTAVRETVRSLRKRFAGRKLWAVFEAKSNTSRRAIFQRDYPPAFDGADVVVLSAPWKRDDLPEAERISIPRMAADIRSRGAEVVEIASVDEIVGYLAERVAPGDVVAGLSGSDFGGFHRKLLEALGREGG